MKFLQNVRTKAAALIAGTTAVVYGSCANALDAAALTTEISSAQGTIETVMLAVLGVAVLFVAFKFIKKAL